MSDQRECWLANPADLHWRGQLAEVGVRATDAIELEAVAHSRQQAPPTLVRDEMSELVNPCPTCGALPGEQCHTPDGPPRADGKGLTYHGRKLSRPHRRRLSQRLRSKKCV